MSEIFTEIEGLKVLYKEIIDGYSYCESKNLYIKHLNDLENAELSRVRFSTYCNLKNEGLPSQEERIKQLIYSQQWSEEKEDRIISCRLQIDDNEKHINKISTNVIKEQRDKLIVPIFKIVEDLKKELSELLLEKRQLLGITANDVAEREGMYFFIRESFYNDFLLKEKYFKTNLDEFEFNEIEDYIKILENNIRKFNEENIKKIAVLGFFLNPFSYSKENIQSFLNKSLSELTGQQLSLISFGSRNLNVLSQTEANPPELVGETTINDLVKFFDQEFSIIQGKSKTSK